MKKKPAKNKVKEIRLPTKFNQGTMKYEPVLPKNIKSYGKKSNELRLSWKWIILLIMGIIAITVASLTLLMYLR